MDIDEEPGYSRELISCDTKEILEQTNLEDLEAYPFEGCDTLYKMLLRNKDMMPDTDALGTRVGDEFKWVTWAELLQ
jgi:hypothetical protein